MAKRTTTIPRGIRNNNPLNIRIGNQWLGERANPNDPAFEQFVAMEYGIRAGSPSSAESSKKHTN